MRLLWRAGLALFALLSVWVILTQHVGRVQGRGVAWAEDDAMVSMQVARHLVEGHGLVWSVGERVEAVSNLGWTLVMAVGQAFLERPIAALWPLLLNVMLGLWALSATRRLALALGAEGTLALLGALGLALSHELIWSTTSGLEAVALAALMGEAWASSAEMRAGKRSWALWPFWMAALAVVLRFDGLIFGALLLGLAWNWAPRKLWAQGVAVVLLPFALIELWRWHYYGAWVPNTVLLKAGAWDGRWLAGWNYVLRWTWDWGLALALALSALRWQALRPWVIVLLGIAAYGLTTAGDFYPGTRYLAPAWPLIWALGAASLARWKAQRVAVAASAACVLLSYNAYFAYPGLMLAGKQDHLDRIEAARVLQEQLKPGETLACAWAGAVFYFSDARGIDLLGKADRVVASRPPDDRGGTGHNKLDLAYSLGVRRPDWVLYRPPQHDGGPLYDQAVHADPLFKAHCAGQAQRIGIWSLCRCRW